MADSGLTYEEEQEALQHEADGEVTVAPPRAFPEVNPEVYKDVEPILYRGFLTQLAEVNEVPFVFKSLNHHEFELITLITGGEARKPSQLKGYYDLFLAYGVLMVDGQNVLADRDKSLSELQTFFGELPAKARQKVISHLSELNRRAFRATMLTEAYTFEVYSRLRWVQLKGMDPTSVAVTGIRGTESLGLNWAQLTWKALNHYEDMKFQQESDWENAKFVASSMAGKGMSKVHAHDRSRREKEREDQIARRDKILRHVLLGEEADGQKAGASASMQVASTVEELADQLQRDLRGEKDWHDQVVDAYETKVREGYQAKAAQLEAIAEKHRQESDGRDLYGGTDIGKGLTPQEVRERQLRQRQINAQRAASQIVYPQLYDEKYAEFMSKWNLPAPRVAQTDRDPSGAMPLPAARPPGTPWRGK